VRSDGFDLRSSRISLLLLMGTPRFCLAWRYRCFYFFFIFHNRHFDIVVVYFFMLLILVFDPFFFVPGFFLVFFSAIPVYFFIILCFLGIFLRCFLLCDFSSFFAAACA